MQRNAAARLEKAKKIFTRKYVGQTTSVTLREFRKLKEWAIQQFFSGMCNLSAA